MTLLFREKVYHIYLKGNAVVNLMLSLNLLNFTNIPAIFYSKAALKNFGFIFPDNEI